MIWHIKYVWLFEKKAHNLFLLNNPFFRKIAIFFTKTLADPWFFFFNMFIQFLYSMHIIYNMV